MPILWDEIGKPDYFGEPDIDTAPRMWCSDCRKRVPYRYDQFGYRECLKCNEEGECHV